MNCSEFRNALEDSVDGRQLAESLSPCEHAQTCVECRGLWDEFLLLEAAIADWKPRTINADLTDRVLATMASTQEVVVPATTLTILSREAGSNPRRSAWPLVTTIALVLVAVVVVLRDRSAEREVVTTNPDPGRQLAVAQPIESVADLSDLLSDAQSAWRGLADSTVRRAREMQVFVPSIRAAAEMEAGSPTETDEPSKTGEPSTTDETDDNIAPVPTEFRRAFEFFFNAAQPENSQTT